MDGAEEAVVRGARLPAGLLLKVDVGRGAWGGRVAGDKQRQSSEISIALPPPVILAPPVSFPMFVSPLFPCRLTALLAAEAPTTIAPSRRCPEC